MKPRDRLLLTSVVILAAGLAAAVLIYLNADDAADEALDAITSSKMYARQLQLYGGKASVVFSELVHWFHGLWHGRRLALTVGSLSALASAVAFLCALREEAEDLPRPGDATLPSGVSSPAAKATAGSSEDPASPPTC